MSGARSGHGSRRVEVRRIYDLGPSEHRRAALVLVDRLWPRGIAKAEVALEEWAKEVAPSTALRQWYGHEPERFDEFARRYKDELRHQPAKSALGRLETLSDQRSVFLVTATRDVEHSGARVLCDVLLRRRAGRRSSAR
jgi:uncharacterized protein YeaO (DUF488 family)